MTTSLLLSNLTVKQIKDVKDSLKSYSEIYIFIDDESKDYHVSTVVSIGSASRRLMGKISKEDVYSEEEQIINYVNSFRDYPFKIGENSDITYKGKKDYKTMLDSGWKSAGIDDSGNIVFNF